MYHWHPLMPDTFNISDTIYTVKDFLFRPDIVIKHGMKDFVTGLVNQRAGAVSIFNLPLLACLYESSGIAKAVTTSSVSAWAIYLSF